MQNNGLRELIVFMECDGLHIRKGKVLIASIAAKFSGFFLFVSSSFRIFAAVKRNESVKSII